MSNVFGIVVKLPLKEPSGGWLILILAVIAVGVLHFLLFRRRMFEQAQKAAIVQSALDGIITVDATGRIVEFNPAAEKMFGYGREEILNRSFMESLVSPAQRRVHQQNLTGYLANGEGEMRGRPFEMAGQRADQREFPLEATIARVGKVQPKLFTITVRDLTDRKRAEGALQESERQFRDLFEYSPDAMFVEDAQGRVLDVNRAACRLHGLKREELIGRQVLDLVPADIRDKVANDYPRLFADEMRQMESFSLAGDGWPVPVEVTTARILYGGRPALLLNLRDITERRRAESALRESEQRFRELFENAPDAMFVEDATGKVLDANRSACLLQGLKREELIGRQVLELAPPGIRDQVARDYPRLFAGELRQLESISLTAEGRTVPVELTAARIHYAGKPALLLNARDITERKLSGEALRHAQEWLLAIFAASRDGISVEEDERIIFANAAFARLLGYDSPQDVTGMHISSLASLEDAERVLEYSRRRLEGEPAPTTYQFKGRCRDGTPVPLEASVSMANFAGRQVILLVSRDITERLKLEAQFLQAQKMESIGQLAGGVAHDFNNILTVILGHASLALMDPQLPGNAADSTREIIAAAERAANLTRQLLTFSRKRVLQLRTLDVNEVVGNLVKMLTCMVGEDIQLKVELANPLPPVRGDTGMLEQVLMNLAVNARDAMPKGGRLFVSTRVAEIDEEFVSQNPQAMTGSFVLLTVTDSGRGIPKEHLVRIFEPFFTTKGPGKGTGLGLATVYGIVKQHGGWIQVCSEVDRGSTFNIYLPAGRGAKKSGDSTTFRKRPRGGTETILLVEDEAAVREMARHVLERAGYVVLESPHGKDALELWQRRHAEIHLLLTDLIMPEGITGLELAQRLRAGSPNLKIICVSGYDGNSLPADMLADTRATFLQKPYAADELIQAVRTCLDDNSRAAAAAVPKTFEAQSQAPVVAG
jgi:PAS domain S-box-containing protein